MKDRSFRGSQTGEAYRILGFTSGGCEVQDLDGGAAWVECPADMRLLAAELIAMADELDSETHKEDE